LSAGFVSVVVDRFSQEYPKAALHVVSADLVTLQYRELSQRKVELAFVPMPGQLPEQEASTEMLLDDRNVILAATHNRWARRRNIALSDLIDDPWVLPPPDSPVGSYIATAFRASGVEPPRASVLTFSIPLYQRLLATGRFLTSAPISMLRHDPTLRRLSVKFPAQSRPVGIMTLKNRMLSPLAERFIECARKIAKPLAKSL
jgi:DNA-binding transcriptional LysR family regulator